MNFEDVSSCDFVSWYPKFEKCTIPSEILELPADALNYLLDPGTLVLPSEKHSVSSTASNSSQSCCSGSSADFDEGSVEACNKKFGNRSPKKVQVKQSTTQPAEYDSEDEEVLNWSNDDTTAVKAPELEEFSARIMSAIKKLGGAVFPKLNWTAPKDAVWISYTGSLKCTSPSDVYLLLKSSDQVNRDLTAPFQGCSDATEQHHKAALVLRRWRDINPSGEFRCFVSQGRFIGMCPRDVSQFYPCLATERASIVADVCSFWRENIDNRFPLKNYAFDIVRVAKDKVLLLDFSPLHESRTRGLLFEWDELQADSLSPTHHICDSVDQSDVIAQVCNDVESLNLINADSNRVCEEVWINDSNSDESLGETAPEFRYISEETGVQPSMDRLYGMPHDLLHLPGLGIGNLDDLLRMQAERSADCHFSDEET
ncbi:Cell division cycle protein 123 [Trinorchestia longiramus]|nr:Cell division cycle protein 123 [Trinorchestia longiramus]